MTGEGEPSPHSVGLRQAWLAAALLSFANILSFIDRQILALLVEPIQADLGASDTQMGLLLGFAFIAFYSLVSYPLGILADRVSRKKLIVMGLMSWSVMTALCGLTKSYASLFVARAGVGAGEASLTPAAFSLLSDLFPARLLARALSIYTIGIFVGVGLAYTLGALVIGALESRGPIDLPLVGTLRPWQLAFILAGVPGVLLGLALLVALPEPRRATRDAAAKGHPREGWAFIRTHAALLVPVTLGMALLSLTLYAATAWVPTFAARIHGIPVSVTGIGFGVVVLVAAPLGAYCGGLLADISHRRNSTWNYLHIIAAFSALLTPIVAIAPFASSPGVALLLSGLALFCAVAPIGIAAAAIQSLTPPRLRAQVSAIYILVINLIAIGCGPAAVPILTDFLFADPLAIDRALAIVMTAAAAGATALLAVSAPRYATVRKLQPETT